jgi:hypothetical protein
LQSLAFSIKHGAVGPAAGTASSLAFRAIIFIFMRFRGESNGSFVPFLNRPSGRLLTSLEPARLGTGQACLKTAMPHRRNLEVKALVESTPAPQFFRKNIIPKGLSPRFAQEYHSK